MVRIVLLVGVLLVASSACGGDDGDDAATDAPGEVETDATAEQTPPPDDDGAPPDSSDEEPADGPTGAAGPSCYEPMEPIGPADEEPPEFISTVMGNLAVEEVAAELESILEGIDGIACPEFPEGLGLGYANPMVEFGDDDVATDAESDLYVMIDGDGNDPSAHTDGLMSLCEELSSFLAEHEDTVGTGRIEIDFGVDPGYEYEPAIRNEAVTPGDPGTCTAA